MTYSCSLPYHAMDDFTEATIRNLLDGDPFNMGLELEEYELHELLDSRPMNAQIWNTCDVISARPDLTHDQAWDVLKVIQGSYAADDGISLHAIRATACDLYGRPSTQ